MLLTESNRKIAACSLVALTVLIGVFNYRQGISIHDPDSRFTFSLFIIGYACLIVYGHRFARITIGAVFLFFAAINSLAILAYVRDFSLNSLLIISITAALTIVGCAMLFWKGIRIFEEERERRIPANS